MSKDLMTLATGFEPAIPLFRAVTFNRILHIYRVFNGIIVIAYLNRDPPSRAGEPQVLIYHVASSDLDPLPALPLPS